MIFGLVGLIIGAAINGAIVGLIVMLAGKIVVKQAPDYGDAFKACFYSALAGALIQFGLGYVLDPEAIWLALGISLLVSYAIYVITFQTIIGYTLGQAAAVAAVATVFLFGAVFGIGMIIGLLSAGA
jgi:hypothetical protein